MASSVDDIFQQIGEFRKYQWFLMTIFGYITLPIASFPVMIVAFITAEPDWKCVDGYLNNTACRFNTSIKLTSDDYKARCKLPREAWTFVDDFTSTVTEVRKGSKIRGMAPFIVSMCVAKLYLIAKSDHFIKRGFSEKKCLHTSVLNFPCTQHGYRSRLYSHSQNS